MGFAYIDTDDGDNPYYLMEHRHRAFRAAPLLGEPAATELRMAIRAVDRLQREVARLKVRCAELAPRRPED